MDTTTITAAEAAVPAAPPTLVLPVPAQPTAGSPNPVPLHWFQKEAVSAAV
ncbi:hypothetical protein [Kitasatospora sp. NPDC097691]|uniref:hypothetical protein n=1 Tax=Kitasatospora sp. NPDC097691 TaxID=3157231 RepID=UPI00332304B2